ncbi:MAG: hypothetical protein KAU20_06220 [Nanoarchaeota archaeon]|nr:hypothetical protein [Nanoarchaeota archaeon]
MVDSRKIVNIWDVESSLYPLIDANGMRNNSTITKSFNLGDNHFTDVRINNFTKNPLSNHSIVSTEEFIFSLNFRKDNIPWFRIDNESKDKKEPKNHLHFHLKSEDKEFREHQKLNDKFTVAELISYTFDWLRNVIMEKYPETKIIETHGFVGTA